MFSYLKHFVIGWCLLLNSFMFIHQLNAPEKYLECEVVPQYIFMRVCFEEIHTRWKAG